MRKLMVTVLKSTMHGIKSQFARDSERPKNVTLLLLIGLD
jgi:hypothetical protein